MHAAFTAHGIPSLGYFIPHDLRLLLHFHYRSFTAHASTLTIIKGSYYFLSFLPLHSRVSLSMLIAFHVHSSLSVLNLGASSGLASTSCAYNAAWSFRYHQTTRPRNARIAIFSFSFLRIPTLRPLIHWFVLCPTPAHHIKINDSRPIDYTLLNSQLAVSFRYFGNLQPTSPSFIRASIDTEEGRMSED